MAVIDKIRLNGIDFELGGGGSNIVEVTQQEYEERPYDPDTLYVIKDAEPVDVSGFATKDELKEKQDKMTGNYLSKVDVGGSSISIETKAFVNEAVQKTDTINFKTINGNAIFGTGDIRIQGGGSEPNVWFVPNFLNVGPSINDLPFYEVKIGDIVETTSTIGNDDVTHQYVIIAKSSLPQNPNNEWADENHLGLIRRRITSGVVVYELVDLRINTYNMTSPYGGWYSVEIKEIGGSIDAYTKAQSDGRYLQKGGLKTVNGQSLEGSGNIEIEGGSGGGSTAKVWTIENFDGPVRVKDLPFNEVKIGDIVQATDNVPTDSGPDNVTYQGVIISKSSSQQTEGLDNSEENHLCVIKRKIGFNTNTYELYDYRVSNRGISPEISQYESYRITKTDIGGSANLPSGLYISSSSFEEERNLGIEGLRLLRFTRNAFDGGSAGYSSYYFSSINGKQIVSDAPDEHILTNFELVTQDEFDSTMGGLKLVKISQDDYDKLANKDANTLYVING